MNPKGYLNGADRGELGRDYHVVTLNLNNFSFLIFGQTPWELFFLEMYLGTI